MTEEKAIETKTDDRIYTIQRVYTKDISFETPNSPGVFLSEWKPEVEINVSTNANTIEEGTFEIILTLTVTVKSDEKTAYLIEVQQAGIFIISGFSQQEMGPIIGVACPSNLFPYAREVISDIVSKGSFPQMVLQPINFEQMYQQHMSELAKQQEVTPEEQPPTTH